MATYTPTATASALPAALGTSTSGTRSRVDEVTWICMPAISDSDVPARSRAETTSGRKRANRSELIQQPSARPPALLGGIPIPHSVKSQRLHSDAHRQLAYGSRSLEVDYGDA